MANSNSLLDIKQPAPNAAPQKKALPPRNFFYSKTEAYTYTIALLTEIDAEYKVTNQHITDCIKKIRIAIENHEQNPKIVQQYLDSIPNNAIPPKYNPQIIQLKLAILNSPYHKQTPQQKFENILQRRLESEICIELITNPTKVMMDVVKNISLHILTMIDVIQTKHHYDIGLLNTLRRRMTSKEDADAFGSLPNISIEEIKNILQQNHVDTLATIMCIHFIFSKIVMRDTLIMTAPQRKPSGHLLKLIQDYLQDEKADPITYFKDHIASVGRQGRNSRSYISDRVMYDSPYYEDRGRGGYTPLWTNQMGLMLATQDRSGLAHHIQSCWQADVTTSTPNYHARVVLDAIENDTIYVGGASGMCSMLLGQMETLGNLESVELKQLYLLTTMAYIVSGGLHSIHEVLGPAEYCLKLIPNYHAPLPDFKDNTLAKAPNFHVFFDLACNIDPDFSQRYELAWTRYMAYFNDHYLSAHPEPPIDISQAISTLFANKPKDGDVLHKAIEQKLSLH